MIGNTSDKRGALPTQDILELIKAGCIMGAKEDNVRPASLDLSLSDEIYLIEGIFLPKSGETVREVLTKLKARPAKITQVLQPDQMYLIRLNETLDLPENVYGFCNPKSTSGRLDVHVRLLADGVSRYDSVRRGAKTELWVSIVPKSFPVKLYQDLCLNQIRFFNLDTRLNDLELELAVKRYQLLWQPDQSAPYQYQDIKIRDNDSSIILTINLEDEILGYEGLSCREAIDLAKVNSYPSRKFFKPIKKKGDYVYLKRGAFYILSTAESVRVPPDLACEMVSMDERSGEFRSHYAGFIDPGWGWGAKGEGKGRPFTLEMRPFEDLIVRHRQPIAKIRFERMAQTPDLTYDSLDSNYKIQTGPRLAKQFKIKK
jgi:dCTP deaminase